MDTKAILQSMRRLAWQKLAFFVIDFGLAAWNLVPPVSGFSAVLVFVLIIFGVVDLHRSVNLFLDISDIKKGVFNDNQPD